jgi:hypothetical protein
MNDVTLPTVIESAVISGDLSKLNSTERLNYYQAICRSLGLNPLTRPFDYITLNGKLTLYARKDATDQLRQIHKISIEKPDIRFEDDWIIVTIGASDGVRTDSDVGVVNRKDMRGDFGNALMKAVTKAKRRVTLSICGLGMLDETEVETIPNARIEPPLQLEPDNEPVVDVEAFIYQNGDPCDMLKPREVQSFKNYMKDHEGQPPESREALRAAVLAAGTQPNY